MSLVTVPGGNGVIITVPFTSSNNAAMAEQLLQSLYYADPALEHIAYTSSGLGSDGAVGNDINALVINSGQQVAVPNGYQYLIGDYPLNPATGEPVDPLIGYGNFNGAVVNSQTSSVSYEAGSGNVTLVAGGNINVTTGPGGSGIGSSAVYLDGFGTQNVSLATGNWSVSTSVGNSTVTLGTGADSVLANGIDTINGGSGTALVTLAYAHDLYHGGQGNTTLIDQGVSDTIIGGAGRVTVFGEGSGLRIEGGAGQVLFTDLSGGHDTITAGSGGGVVYGTTTGCTYDTGGAYFFFTSGGGTDTITAAAGSIAPIAFGSPNGIIDIHATAAGSFAVAGAGNETIDAASSSSGTVYFSGTGNADLIGGQGSDFFCASTGNSTMSGGTGNVYEFINGHAGATDIIKDFGGSDSLYLAGFGTAAGDGIRSEVENNDSLTMMLGDGTQIVFQNISSAAQLTGHIFNI